MRVLKFNKVNLLSKLHDELLAAVPSVQAVQGLPVMTVEGTPTTVQLTVPDTADVAAITAVINAHDPTPIPPPPAVDYGGDANQRNQVPDAVVQLRQYLNLASPTGAQTVAALKLLIRVVLFLATRVIG